MAHRAAPTRPLAILSWEWAKKSCRVVHRHMSRIVKVATAMVIVLTTAVALYGLILTFVGSLRYPISSDNPQWASGTETVNRLDRSRFPLRIQHAIFVQRRSRIAPGGCRLADLANHHPAWLNFYISMVTLLWSWLFSQHVNIPYLGCLLDAGMEKTSFHMNTYSQVTYYPVSCHLFKYFILSISFIQ